MSQSIQPNRKIKSITLTDSNHLVWNTTCESQCLIMRLCGSTGLARHPNMTLPSFVLPTDLKIWFPNAEESSQIMATILIKNVSLVHQIWMIRERFQSSKPSASSARIVSMRKSKTLDLWQNNFNMASQTTKLCLRLCVSSVDTNLKMARPCLMLLFKWWKCNCQMVNSFN